jgi:hypothetical protein
MIMLGASTVLGYATFQQGIDGDLMLLNVAFVMMTLGASDLVAGTRFEKRVTVDSMSPSTATVIISESDFVFKRAEPTTVTTAQTDEYLDPRLSDASDFQLSQPMVALAELLETHGFEPVKQVLLHQDHTRIFTALSLGCHNVVLCELGDLNHYQQVRFVSVLSDGFVVISLSPNTPQLGSALRVGLHGVYARGTSESIVTLLSEHLDRVAAIAEQRDRQLVTFDSYEKLDVFLLGRRTLLDIQNECQEVTVVVSKAKYGRFSFPGQHVESIATV